MPRASKDEMIAGLVDEYVKSIECYVVDINKILDYDCAPDDMRKIAKICSEMAQYAEETADEIEELM